jgi:hypothetical protein
MDPMSKRRAFRTDGLDALEGRLAPAAVVPGAAVVQAGQHEGQFGDQTTPDAPGTSEGRGEDGPETGGVAKVAGGTVGAQATRSGAVPHRAASTVTAPTVQHNTASHAPIVVGRPHPVPVAHPNGLRHR